MPEEVWMPASPLRLIKNAIEHCTRDMISEIPGFTRGIYVLLKYRPKLDMYDVVYVGMTRSGVKRRLQSHARSKKAEWDHFSVFAVWDNVRDEEIEELEGLFRHIYKFDTKANRLNVAKSFKKLNKIRKWQFDDWN